MLLTAIITTATLRSSSPIIAYGRLLSAKRLLYSFVPNTSLALSSRPYGVNNNNNNHQNGNKRVVILNFDDGWKSQYTNATPILNKYGFKATFYVVCNYIGKDESRLNWQDISGLYKEGNDIESHTMNHNDLTKMSKKELEYEIGQSKQCLLDHGINNVTSFAYPFNKGAEDIAVVKVIAKYYSLARTATHPLMFLHCNVSLSNKSSLSSFSSLNQTDCRTYADNGKLNRINRYSIIGWTHHYPQLDDSQMFNAFVDEVNSQNEFNKNGTINAIPIIIYHRIDNTKIDYSTDIGLFDSEMKYLHDNGFKVLTMADLGYDENSKHLYIMKSGI
jgi:peptidoglycan/xylan/chitin deacetylase (PgdA/CDA1 family)